MDWIDPSKQPPKNNERVIVFGQRIRERFDIFKNGVFSKFGSEVMFWQPLPEAPWHIEKGAIEAGHIVVLNKNMNKKYEVLSLKHNGKFAVLHGKAGYTPTEICQIVTQY